MCWPRGRGRRTGEADRASADSCQSHIKRPLFSAKAFTHAPVFGEKWQKRERPFDVKYVAAERQVQVSFRSLQAAAVVVRSQTARYPMGAPGARPQVPAGAPTSARARRAATVSASRRRLISSAVPHSEQQRGFIHRRSSRGNLRPACAMLWAGSAVDRRRPPWNRVFWARVCTAARSVSVALPDKTETKARRQARHALDLTSPQLQGK